MTEDTARRWSNAAFLACCSLMLFALIWLARCGIVTDHYHRNDEGERCYHEHATPFHAVQFFAFHEIDTHTDKPCAP